MERFWNKTNKSDDGCWNWGAGVANSGYGKFKLNKKTRLAHRVSWELTNGKIPKGKQILHTCDNKLCVNPDHLFLGTQADNVEDMINKNRDAIVGENNNKAKLTKEQVLEIREKYSDRKTMLKDIAPIYGVDLGTISQIIRNKTWKHL